MSLIEAKEAQEIDNTVESLYSGHPWGSLMCPN